MQVKPCTTSVQNFKSLSLQRNFLWSKEENLLIQIVSRFGIKSLSEVKYAWQQLLDQLMDFKSLNVEQQGKTSATNGPKFNWLSQQTNHLLLKEQDKPLIILSRIGIKTTHHHHQVPDLEQTLATMPLQTSLSSDNFKKFKPLLCPPVAELQRLSRNVIRCLPLSRLPSTLLVRDKNSKPLRLHTCPKNSICLFLIVFNSDL